MAILAGMTSFGPLSIDMYLPALPTMARDLAAPPAAGALTVAAFYVGLCLGQLIHGPLSDRLGRRPPLIVGVALYVLASVGGALCGAIGPLIVLRFFQALGGCAGMVIGRAVVRDRFTPAESAHVFSILLLVMSLAPVLAPLLGSFVLLIAGWRSIFWILAGFGTLLWVGIVFGLAETRSEATASHARGESVMRSYAALLGEPRVMGYALLAGCSHMGLLTYLAITPDVLIGGFGLSPRQFGWTIAVNGIGLVAANFFNRRLLGRLGYDTILRRANIGSIVASAVLFVDAFTGFVGLAGVVVPLFFMVGLIGFTQPNAFAGALAHDPRRAGAASALVGCLQFGAGALGASIAGAFHDGTARPMAAVILTAYLLGGALLRTLAPSQR
ncbi:multidrug effflux MFS transporter [Sphingomonas sp. MMS24-J13]|uniref:multidrug effflux MFS transporter n=1 Tax=Sphingomonas sp. MMS24-J13 TaxID=3238686 RepID=UPI00384D97AF